jgi:hypothetical protein
MVLLALNEEEDISIEFLSPFWSFHICCIDQEADLDADFTEARLKRYTWPLDRAQNEARWCLHPFVAIGTPTPHGMHSSNENIYFPVSL